MRIPFVKMHGAANDFVVIDHREPFLPAAPEPLFARLCDRRRGVGADGVLLLERRDGADFAMRYHNADGGPADFCGNGARCIARFALDRGLGRDGAVTFHTAVGAMSARGTGDGRIELRFGTVPRGGPVTLESGGRAFRGWLVTPGVPHFVVAVPDVADVPLLEWARPLRSHPHFGPPGANVDFVTRLPDGRVAMRTYERGVEGETLACGSGAIATALWAVTVGEPSPVTVLTAGGDELVVALEDGPRGCEAILTGPAEVAFRGEVDVAIGPGAGSASPAR